ncbi:DEAD/DEAH box helicase [Candidatus Woesearchaeota archaeon]|nr:MAG: DEAD/DEAH box helicase [Candidatus Woesearchaeota archaeon]
MHLLKHKEKIPEKVYSVLEKRFSVLRPCQVKAINQGLFEDKNMVICTPTASGKTLVGELAVINAVFHDKGKAVYIVPLRALASEKYNEFKERYSFKTAISSGDIDSSDDYLSDYDLIITTSEKFDSLLRHHTPWLKQVKVVIVDEIHLLNDASRGPTLEILITMLRMLLKNVQIIGLSATIGNPEQLANWLNAELVLDTWRPVRLDQGIYLDGEIEFY